jgi:hypothetical protein
MATKTQVPKRQSGRPTSLLGLYSYFIDHCHAYLPSFFGPLGDFAWKNICE